MYYFIEIIYLISTVSSVSLKIDNNLYLKFRSKLNIISTLGDPLDKTENHTLLSPKHDPNDTGSDENYHPKSLYLQKHIPIAPFSKQDDLSSEQTYLKAHSEEKMLSMHVRTTQNKHTGRYESTKLMDVKNVNDATTIKIKKGRNTSSQRLHKRKRIMNHESNPHKKLTTAIDGILNKRRNKNNKSDTNSIYSENTNQKLFNKSDHSLYVQPYVAEWQLYGTYDTTRNNSSLKHTHKPSLQGNIRNKSKSYPISNKNYKSGHKNTSLGNKNNTRDGNRNAYLSAGDAHFIEFPMPKLLFNQFNKISISNINSKEDLQVQWEQQLQNHLINKAEYDFAKKVNESKQEVLKKLNSKLKKYKIIRKETSNLWQPWIHRVRDDAKVNAFMKHILNNKLELFQTIENIGFRKEGPNSWQSNLRNLAKTYEEKFNEFIEETGHHKIKSRMGTERVILNSIDVSNRIATRLLNFVMYEIEEKEISRKSATSKMIAKKIKEETKLEHKRACLNLGVCKRSTAFIEFVVDFMTTLLSLDDNKLGKAYDSMTVAINSTDFTNTLGFYANKGLKENMASYNHVNIAYKRGMLGALKNIVTNRNTPLIVYGDSNESKVKKTIAFLEIIKTLEEVVPENSDNVIEWYHLKTTLNDYAEDKEADIKTIMLQFIGHLKNVIDRTDAGSWTKILSNFNTLYKAYVLVLMFFRL